MSKKTVLLSLGYWFSSITLGLLVHPYKTAREVVRLTHFRALVLTPLVWVGVFWVGAVCLVLIGRYVALFGAFVYPRFMYTILNWVFWWAVWFAGLWQLVIAYLFGRFRRSF